VSRILAHGGIPASCSREFADLVVREVSNGAPSGQELAGLWRARKSQLPTLHKPTRRFLVYGGDPATDLLDRCIELLRSHGSPSDSKLAAESNVPAHIVEAFSGMSSTSLASARRQVAVGIPLPRLQLDPYTGLGPTVVLPNVPSDKLGGAWRVSDGSSLGRYAPSAFATSTVRVSPTRSVEVEFVGVHDEQRRWFFECLDRIPAMFFVPETGDLIRSVGSLQCDDVWVLHPESTEIRLGSGENGGSAPRAIQELPNPGGAWKGFVLSHIDLIGIDQLEFVTGPEVLKKPVRRADEKPDVAGDLVEGARTRQGHRVFASVPELRLGVSGEGRSGTWNVQLVGPDGSRSITLDRPEEAFALDQLELPNAFGEYRLTVRGPLGADLSTEFAVIPGLDLKAPEFTAFPGEDVSVRVRAPNVSVGQGVEGEATEVEPGLNDSLVEIPLAETSGRALELVARIPRLLWTVVHESKPSVEPQSQPLQVGKEEFDDHLADLLLVSVGRQDIEMYLELRGPEGKKLAASERVGSTGLDGRWAFNLGEFSDLIRASTSGRLALELHVGARTAHVADIVTPVEISRFVAATAGSDDELEVSIQFVQDRPVDGRVLRLWPELRPWANAVTAPIPDGATQVTLADAEKIRPGPHLAEVAIEDPWRSPKRPSPDSSGTRVIDVGTSDDLDQYLERLEPGDPESLIVLALSGRFRETTFEIEQLSEHSSKLASAIRNDLSRTPLGAPTPRSMDRLLSIAGARDQILCNVLLAAAESEASDFELARLSLRALGTVEPKNDPVHDAEMAALWSSNPAIAAKIDLPRASNNPDAMDRCRTALGWGPGDPAPSPAGARLNQLLLSMDSNQLREIRRTIGVIPGPVLSAEALQCASFDWLIANNDRDDNFAQNWFYSHRHLAEHSPTADPELREVFEATAATRERERGTEEWASLPRVCFYAAAHFVWESPEWYSALAALDGLAELAPSLIVHDLLLVAVLAKPNLTTGAEVSVA
jgi:hypothetical protein